MSEQVNSFNGGLDMDTTKALVPKNKYRDAKNIHLITSGLDSSGSLANSDGNVSSFSIPTTSNVIKLIGPVVAGNVQVNINGTLINVTVNANTEFKDLSNAVNANATLQALAITAAYSDTYVLIYSQVVNNLTVTPNIVVSNLVNISQSGNPYILAQTTPTIIGSTTIRDAFIIFTTTETSSNPGGHDSTTASTATQSAGQIWKLVYDPVTFVATLTLLYNNYIDLTTFHPIPPSAAEGRYETLGIQNAYWTDNFNELRVFNTANSNGFGIDPTLLSTVPNADYSVPILRSIQGGGSLPTGAYQASFRYKNTGGATTLYSKTSNIVPIVNGLADSTPFRNYKADGASNSGKSITWNIDGLDTDYERIEIVILYREFRTDIPIIDQVFDEPIPSTGDFTFTYTGNETKLPVSVNDFLDPRSTFITCKTIVSKTNQLLVGNVKNTTFDVDFDARAYRFNTYNPFNPNNKADIQDSQGNTITITRNQVINNLFTDQTTWDIPEEHDAINPNQTDQSNNIGYRFQSDGQTLGGEGPNIKYTFDMEFIMADSVTGFPTFTAAPYGENSRFANQQPNNFTVNNNTFKSNNFYDSFKSPYRSSALKGHQHDEVYSFAIQFFDKKGRPGFAKWIGDIRMPSIHETTDSSLLTNMNYLPLRFNAPLNQWEVGILVPKFDVTISAALASKISGWNIVRCERTTQDKTVLAAGILHRVNYNGSANVYQAAVVRDVDAYGANFAADSPSAETEACTFTSPEFLFLQYPGFLAGDKLKIVSRLDAAYWSDLSITSASDIRLFKNYWFNRQIDNPILNAGSQGYNYFIERPLDEAIFVPKGGTVTLGSKTITNIVGAPVLASEISQGDDTVFMDWYGDDPIDFSNLYGGLGNSNKYYALYKRVVTNQYGGNTYSSRTNREYISTGHYQEINNSTFPSSLTSKTFSVKVFGGDMYTNIFDYQKNIKYWANASAGTRSSVTRFFPVTSVLNTEWRALNSVNSAGLPNVGAGGADVGDDYSQYNSGWAFENNTQRAYPKPDPFTDVQEYDTRVYISGVKINGEQSDSWGNFKVNDYRDVEGNRGPITALLYFKDNIYCIQNNALCLLPINPNVTIPDNSSSTLVLGTGDGIGPPVYISTHEGSRHQWSCLASDTAVYFFDIKNKIICKVRSSTEPISFIKGVDSYLTNNLLGSVLKLDNPIDNTVNLRSGVLAAYNPNTADMLFTFHDVQSGVKSSFTLAYNEVVDAFTSFYDFKPTIYLADRRNLFSSDLGNQVWLHEYGNKGQFYGTTFDSFVSFLVNSDFDSKKVFDNLEWASSVTTDTNSNINILNETWSSLRVFNDHQNTTTLPLTASNLKRIERTWQTQIPRNLVTQNLSSVDITNSANLSALQLFTDRLRGDHIQVDLTLANGVSGVFREFSCPYIKTLFRASQR